MKPSRTEIAAIIISLLLIITAVTLGIMFRAAGSATTVTLRAIATDTPAPTPPRTGIPGPDAPVNINTGSWGDLQTLKGIGPVTAQKIIDFRTAYGEFEHISQLMDVSGIGFGTYENIKNNITI